MTLSLHIDHLRKDLALIGLDGTVDATSAPDVKAAIDPFLAGEGVIVILDMDDLSFIDSAGLGALIGTQRRLRERGSELRLTRVPSHVQKLLHITALDQALPIHASDEEE
ncbi:MAG: STAS domain-containing protein [Iamia sp.]